MKIRSVICYLILAVCLLALMPVVHAEDEQSPTVIYQTTFSTDPQVDDQQPDNRLLGFNPRYVSFLHRAEHR